MKIFLTSTIVFLFTFSYAQCDNQVRTNPGTANNLSLPDVGVQLNSPDSSYLNGFNWWTDGFYPLTNMMYNPTQPYTSISNVQDPFSVEYYDYLVEALGAEEMNPQNGWELLLVNLGRYPDNINPAPITTLQEIPYIVLYNKFNGKLRVFVQYGYNVQPELAVDGLKIRIYYNDQAGTTSNKSTILRLGKGKDNTLDQLNPGPSLTSICPPNGSAISQWMSADFQLTYDPCVCFFPTNLSVQFNFFSETDFKLTGRSVSVEDDLVSANGTINNQDFLSTVSQDNSNGYIIYDKMAALADDYIMNMEAYADSLVLVEAYNEQVEKKLLAIKIFKQAVSIGLLATTGTPGFAQFALAWPAINFKKIVPVTGATVIDTAKSKAFYGKVEEILGEYANTFISESLKKKDDPTQPIMPMVTLTEMQFLGTLSNADLGPNLLFSTPGSFKNSPTVNDLPVYNLPQTYPVYNQPLGVFALLETPKVSQSKTSKVSISNCEDVVGPNPLDPFNDIYYGQANYRSTENRSQFKLNSPLKYTFNPVLNYSSKKVSAMYVIKTKVKDNNIGSFPLIVGNEINYTSKIYDASVNLNSSTINTYSNDLIWDYLNSPLLGSLIVFKKDSLSYSSEFIPIDAFNNFVVEIATNENDLFLNSSCAITSGTYVNGFNQEIWDNFDVQIKLKVDVEYVGTHSNGDPHEYSYVFTYDVADGNLIPVSTPFVPNIAGSNSDLLQYPSNLTYGTTVFNGSVINGCELVGSVYTCQAWNDIEINGNIDVISPFQVNFIAGNQINVLPESIVSPESTLSIQQLLDYSSPMPEAASSYVTGFCQGTNPGFSNYKGNTPSKSTTSENLLVNDNLSNENTFWDFNLYPNPTSENAVVTLIGNNSNSYSIELTDMTGKVLYTKENNVESPSSILDLFGIVKGVYLVKVYTAEGAKIKQLIVQ